MSTCNHCLHGEDAGNVCKDCDGNVPYDIEDDSSTDDDDYQIASTIKSMHPSGEQAEQMHEYRLASGM